MKKYTTHLGAKATAGLIFFGLMSAGCFTDKQADGNESGTTAVQARRDNGALHEFDAEGRGHLYREEVEIYWNNWWAIPAIGFEPPVGSDEVRIEIVGEGKTADFLGVLAISCMDDKAFWITGSHFGEELVGDNIDKFVPLEVKIRARERFCRTE